MKVLIITGGDSSERNISLTSAAGVEKALQKNGFVVEVFDLRKGLESLRSTIKNYDVIFPVLHGEEGEGGDLQKFLQKQNIRFVGGSWKGFKKGWYKIPFKNFCRKENILTPEWRVVKSNNDILKFGFPCVLKTSNGGSSREVAILNSEKDLGKQIVHSILESNQRLFVEKFIKGIEVTAGIFNNKSLPLIEIIPPPGKWFDYKNKYSGATREIIDAPSLNLKVRKKVQQIALKIHKNLNLGQYSRIDFIVSQSLPFVLDVNTIPGLTSKSLFPKEAKAIGLDFPKLVKLLVTTAKKKYD